MIINQKIKLKLKQEDIDILDSQSRMCNKIYNMLLDKVNNDKKINDSYDLLKGRNLRNEVVKIKQDHRYFYSVHSSPLKNAALRLKDAFDRIRKQKNAYPHFRSWSRKWFSLYYDEANKGIKIKKKTVRISLGYKLDDNKKKVRLYVDTLLTETLNVDENCTIKNYRITKKYDDYFLVVCIEKPDVNLEFQTGKVIAIDPNHTNFFVGIDNERKSIEFENLYHIKYFDKQIDKLKSKIGKCKRKSIQHTSKSGITYYTSSKRYIRLNKALNNVYHKKKVQTDTALYLIANKLVKEYDIIAIGDYIPDVKNITNDRMNRSMLNQTVLSKFRKILEHVCKKNGKLFLLVDEAFTTQTCHHCLDKKKKAPDIRTYTCPKCGTKYHRDINSAINIGVKANILSSSDYDSLDLSRVSYTASYNLQKQVISYCN